MSFYDCSVLFALVQWFFDYQDGSELRMQMMETALLILYGIHLLMEWLRKQGVFLKLLHE